MKRLFIFYLLFISIQINADELLTLHGNAIQGGILIGNVHETVEKIFLDSEEIPISENEFIIGFDRDEKLRHILTLVLENGEMETIKFFISKREYVTQRIDGIPAKYLEEPTEEELITRIESESDTLKKTRKKLYKNSNIYFENFSIPVENGKVTGIFGSNRILNGIPISPHNGYDIAASEGTEIKAMSTGLVALTGNYFYNGKFVLIDHGSGLSSIYIHMSRICVEKGDYIIKGDKIGEVGSTGRSTGNHLHWGVGWRDKKIDPGLILNNKKIFLTLKKY
ncbi:MAG: M23 family metallopeptidase [Candidatus Cloacimonetes bacterium]|nr:M23 family metallopeptidase [Candidatus Cloacimonadota bacterium]